MHSHQPTLNYCNAPVLSPQAEAYRKRAQDLEARAGRAMRAGKLPEYEHLNALAQTAWARCFNQKEENRL